MILVWAKFLFCVLLILFFGTRLSRYGHIIAEKTGLSGIWIGLLLLAAVTSLPELITGIGAVTLVGDPEGPDLAMGTALGSNLFNLVIIALMDIIYRAGPLLTMAGPGHRLSAGLGILLTAVAGGSILLGTKVWGGAIGWVSIYSLVLILLYVWGSRRIFRSQRQGPEIEAEALQYKGVSSRRAYSGFAIAAIAIIGAATWLAMIGDEIATLTGWGGTFVGSLFLAATTSLPELAVSIAALRIGAVDMAIANMLGSNMLNVGIVIAGDDLFYRSASIFSAVSTSNALTASVAILMTLIVVAGLISRPQRKTPFRMSWYSIALIVVYITGAYFLFTTGVPTG